MPESNRTETPSILRNISWFTGASALVKPAWFIFITAFCMRILGVGGYGLMNAALSFMIIAVSFSDLGTNPYTIREVARNRNLASRYFSNIFLTRLLLAIVACLVAWLVAWQLGYDRTELATLLAAALYAGTLRLLEFCRTFYRAFEVLQFEAVSILVEKVMVIIGGTAMLWYTRSPAGTLLGMGVAMLGALMLNVVWIHRRLAVLKLRLISWRFIRVVIAAAIPLGLYALFNRTYFRIGVVILESLGGAEAAGIYGVAFRIIEALQLLPMVVVAAILPRLSRLYHQSDYTNFERLLGRSLLAAGSLALIGATVLSIWGPDVVQLLDGRPQFFPAGALLQFLIWVFPLMTINHLLTATLIATDRQKPLAGIFGCIVILNPALNVILIPHFSYYGAATALLVSEGAILAACSAIFFHIRRSWRSS